MWDRQGRVKASQALAPAARTASVNGATISVADFESATFIVNVGTITDGTHTPKLQDSPDGTTWTDVDASLVTGTAFVALVSNTVQKVGYIGVQPKVRVVVTVSGATTGGVYGATCELGIGRKLPQ